jgi:hypothetical protein
MERLFVVGLLWVFLACACGAGDKDEISVAPEQEEAANETETDPEHCTELWAVRCTGAGPNEFLACVPCRGLTTDIGYVNRVTDGACFQLPSGEDVPCICQSDEAAEFKECTAG